MLRKILKNGYNKILVIHYVFTNKLATLYTNESYNNIDIV